MNKPNRNVKTGLHSSISHLPAFFYIVFLCIGITGCKKMITVSAPVTSTNASLVYQSDATAASVLTGIYSNMNAYDLFSAQLTSMSTFAGLSADELAAWSGSSNNILLYYQNALPVGVAGFPHFWNNIYPVIFVSNAAIEGITSSTSLTPAVKQQLLGEAKFIRAFCYFYLVNLYGEVPLALSTDYQVNRQLPRTSVAQVYTQIIADLKEAQSLLNTSYLKADVLNVTQDRVRPNKWVATALLSRTYLYAGENSKAEAEASVIINNNSSYDTISLTNVFKVNSKEAIWQLPSLSTGVNTNTWEGRLFILPSVGPNGQNPVYLSNNIINSFEPGDKRQAAWTRNVTVSVAGVPTTYNYPYKYQVGAVSASLSEYSTLLRLAEQYLIRAEARAKQANTTGAAEDLNVIRKRAGLPNTTASTQPALLAAILQERKVELFTEWGHRWLDLKRSGTVDSVMNIVTPQKGGTWNKNWQYYPIPLDDLQRALQLKQNDGYN